VNSLPAQSDAPRCPTRSAAALALLLALALASAGALAQEVPRAPAGRLAESALSLEYRTGHDPVILLQADGFTFGPGQSAELTIRSSAPTQLRLYAIPASGEARFRQLVLTSRAPTMKRTLAYEAFDPAPDLARGEVPPGGALLVLDVPGFMRKELQNELTLGPCRVTSGAAPLPAEQCPPAPGSHERDSVHEKILGGWLGKVAGCHLGMPMEGQASASLERAGELTRGLPAGTWGFGPDDDTSLAVSNLLLLEEEGEKFAPAAVLAAWRDRFAYEYLWKTERRSLELAAAGAGLAACGQGPQEGSICARIRCDLWGLVSPGRPERARSFVERDAPLSNRGDGVNSALVVATAVSLAFEERSPRRLLERTLEALGPRAGRHREVLGECLRSHAAGEPLTRTRDWLDREVAAPIRAKDSANAWAYALPNDGLVALALLHGEGDFARTVALAACLGWDSDCNAGTAALLVGVMNGADAIPASFAEPLHDRLRVAIPGREHWSIRQLAWRTWKAAKTGL
jgi:ADP-ribosylglycohydrolase